jgi:hypothetical protein
VISTGKSGYPICSSKQLGAYSREMPDDCLVQSLPSQWVTAKPVASPNTGNQVIRKSRVNSAFALHSLDDYASRFSSDFKFRFLISR